MNDYIIKRCTKCEQEYPATPEYFERDKQKRDGLSSQCKQCRRATKQIYRDENRDEYRRKMREWHASHRDKSHEHGAKWRNANREHIRVHARLYRIENQEKIRTYNLAYQSARPEVGREATRRWRLRNPDYSKHSSRLYRLKNPIASIINKAIRRARKYKLPNSFNKHDWNRCLDYFNHRCAVCGNPVGFWHVLAQDHWIALASPRPNNPGTVPWNIVPLCNSINDGQGGCNNNKNDKDPEQWLIERFGKRKANAILKRILAYFEWVKQQD